MLFRDLLDYRARKRADQQHALDELTRLSQEMGLDESSSVPCRSMHSHFTVLYDAFVIYPQVLRDILLQLNMTELQQ